MSFGLLSSKDEFSNLEESEQRMFIGTVDVDLFGQFEIRFETISRSNVFQTVQDLRSIIAWFLLHANSNELYSISKVGDRGWK